MKNQNIIDLFHFAVTGDSSYISSEYLKKNRKEIKHPIYRGLLLPTKSLQKEYVVKEWYGCSHWTSKKSIAKRFTNGTEVEEYIEEYGLEHGCDGTFEEGIKLFSKVILKLSKAEALPVGKKLLQNKVEIEEYLMFNPNETNESLDELICEDEFAIFGYDFKIQNVTKENDVYMVTVEAIFES